MLSQVGIDGEGIVTVRGLQLSGGLRVRLIWDWWSLLGGFECSQAWEGERGAQPKSQDSSPPSVTWMGGSAPSFHLPSWGGNKDQCMGYSVQGQELCLAEVCAA